MVVWKRRSGTFLAHLPALPDVQDAGSARLIGMITLYEMDGWMMPQTEQRLCWCGNSQFVHFSDEYLRCASCDTLVSQVGLSDEQLVVHNDDGDFYGREYWFAHQEQDLGFKNITMRARLDLPERCLYWLRTVLKYKLPQGKALELGCAHGGFAALLQWAGFEATGLELSSWVVDFAHRTFNLPMLLGPVENQEIEPGTLDVIALMDVLEHLPDPLGTMRHCLHLLKPDGILVIQTPCYPEGKTYAAMLDTDDPFLYQLKSNEHLYLFGRSSVRKLFQMLEAENLVFEPALFAHYDMFLVASRHPLETHSPGEVERVLSSRPSQRLVQALLDADDRYQQATQRLAESEADRAARLRVIEEQGQHLIAAANLHQQIDGLAAERAELQRAVEQLQQQLATQQHQLTAQQHQLTTQQHQLATIRATLLELRTSRVYRAMRALGRWAWLERAFDIILPRPERPKARIATERSDRSSDTRPVVRRIAVDLTPVLPGGENGGAKLVALEVVKHLSQIAPECEFVLLTSSRSHAELAPLDAPNVRRLCVHHETPRAASKQLLGKLRTKVRNRVVRILPARALRRVRSIYQKMSRRSRQPNILKELNVDLIFCPFTAPFFFDPTIPMVGVVYDLQHIYYPQFFSANERSQRARNFTELCSGAARIICISDYVRGTVLANANIDPGRVKTVHIQLPHRVTAVASETAAEILNRLGLEHDQLLLYPANFWQHKNHAMLLTAFGMFCARHPESRLKLVCTGHPSARMDELELAAKQMSLNDRAIFPGYIPDEQLAALLQSCYAVIFPSLYEGFGMPLIEAMAFGKPVLCANSASLPEVAGDAALLFDPRKPDEIVAAIELLVSTPGVAAQLAQKGSERVAAFGDPAEMARQYLEIFREAIGDAGYLSDRVYGVYPDGWTSNNVIVTFSPSIHERRLEVTLMAPDWIPHERLSAHIAQNGGAAETFLIHQGQTLTISRVLPSASGFVELLIDPLFQPKALGLGDDERGLGCVFQACRVVSQAGDIDLWEGRN